MKKLFFIIFFVFCVAKFGFTQNNESKLQDENNDSTMIFIEGGKFIMGGGLWPNTYPSHEVRLHSFYIDRQEVTQKEFQNYCTQTGSEISRLPDNRKNDCEKCPVEGISYNQAKKYCNYYQKRLPTEAEWEYAACGGEKRYGYFYSGSNEYNKVAWFMENGGYLITGSSSLKEVKMYKASKTHEVGKLEPNEFGLFDMNGNVWEWCEDWYKASYSKNDSINPAGPDIGSKKVIRGGSVLSSYPDLSVRERGGLNPEQSYWYSNPVGFRCVKDH